MSKLFAYASGGAALVLLCACGKVSDPKDVDVTKLKPALDLQVIPGDGYLTLVWNAINNEKDFSGFNVYLSTDAADTVLTALAVKQVDELDPHRFTPVAFKDDKDEDTTARATLAQYFNWDFTAAKSQPSADKKTFTPFARCNVTAQDKGGECVAFALKEDKSFDEPANINYRANGRVYMKVNGLTNGTSYVAFVTSSMDKGKKISSPTSNVLQVAPRAVSTLTYEGTGSIAAKTIPFSTALKVDNTTGAIGYDLATGVPVQQSELKKGSGTYCKPLTGTDVAKTDFYFDYTSSTPAIVGSNGARIASLGPIPSAASYVNSDLLGSMLRMDGTALVPKSETLQDAEPTAGDTGLKTGYSRCGQSVILNSYSLYSIAYVDGTTTRYALLETGLLGTATFDSIRIAVAKAQDRRL